MFPMLAFTSKKAGFNEKKAFSLAFLKGTGSDTDQRVQVIASQRKYVQRLVKQNRK